MDKIVYFVEETPTFKEMTSYRVRYKKLRRFLMFKWYVISDYYIDKSGRACTFEDAYVIDSFAYENAPKLLENAIYEFTDWLKKLDKENE